MRKLKTVKVPLDHHIFLPAGALQGTVVCHHVRVETTTLRELGP
jgi:hypothetical protein